MPGVSWRFKTPSHCLQYNPKCFLLGRQDDGFPTRTFQILRQSYLAVCLDFVVSGRGSTATRFRGCCAIRMRTCRTRTQLRSNCTTGMLTPSSTRQQKPRLKMGCHYLAFKFNLGSYTKKIKNSSTLSACDMLLVWNGPLAAERARPSPRTKAPDATGQTRASLNCA